MLTTILIIILVIALAGGAWSYPASGPYGLTPAGVILLVLLVLWLAGRLHT